MGSIGNNNVYNAIHNFQQVSWEGITEAEKQDLSRYIDSKPDVTSQISRGMIVPQSIIDEWTKNGAIQLNDISSWTQGNEGTAQRFADVSRKMDAEDGQRSVILIADNGLPNSASLPRTNVYDEKEVLSKVNTLDIVDVRVQENPYRTITGYRSFSPTITVIKVKGGR